MNRLLSLIAEKSGKKPLLIAIDGRCGSGKTTLAAALERQLGCAVIHLDDFFLRPEQRTAARLSAPGENVDHERFLAEVLQPLSAGKSVCYRPFDCSVGALGEQRQVEVSEVVVIEGSYALHPALAPYYDIKVFSDIDPDTQIGRLAARAPEKLEAFCKKWIPLEEAYFQAFSIPALCDIIIKTEAN